MIICFHYYAVFIYLLLNTLGCSLSSFHHFINHWIDKISECSEKYTSKIPRAHHGIFRYLQSKNLKIFSSQYNSQNDIKLQKAPNLHIGSRNCFTFFVPWMTKQLFSPYTHKWIIATDACIVSLVYSSCLVSTPVDRTIYHSLYMYSTESYMYCICSDQQGALCCRCRHTSTDQSKQDENHLK